MLMQPKLGFDIECFECDTSYEVWIRDEDLVPNSCSFCGVGLTGTDVWPSEQRDVDEE